MVADSSLGNVISRLQGLKNVSGRRRVMPGAEVLEGLEEPDMDVEGTAQPLPDFAQFQPPAPNMPEADMGGELTSQSYDVRANVANPPQEEPGFWGKIGKALADYVSPQKRAEMSDYNRSLFNKSQGKEVAQTPPIETAQVDMQEGLPPVTASEELQPRVRAEAPQPSPGVLGAISDYFNPTKRDQMKEYNSDLMQDAQLRTQGSNLDEAIAQENQSLQQDITKAMEEPWQHAAYGATQQVAENPQLTAQFREITGMDLEPQVASMIQEHESAMKGVEDALNGINTDLDATAEGIKQRILNNQSTDADKFYIGLALLMPLLIGGLFGKEAALGALGGASQGFANVLGGRQKAIQEDEASLMDIAKQKSFNQEKLANIGLEKAKLGPAIRKSLPEDPNAHILGMREAVWTDPKTGEEMRGIEIKPGLMARPELVTSKEALTDMRKAANELSEVRTYVDDVNDLTDDIANIVVQLDDPSTAWKGFTQLLTNKSPTSLAKLSQDVMFDGRKQNAGVLLEEKLGFLANKYGMAQELGQLDRAAQNHIKKIIENPTNSFISPEDSLNQILEIRKLSQRGLIRSAANKGFVPEFLENELQKVNEPLFERLNQRGQDKRVADIEKKLSQNEKRYAK